MLLTSLDPAAVTGQHRGLITAENRPSVPEPSLSGWWIRVWGWAARYFGEGIAESLDHHLGHPAIVIWSDEVLAAAVDVVGAGYHCCGDGDREAHPPILGCDSHAFGEGNSEYLFAACTELFCQAR